MSALAKVGIIGCGNISPAYFEGGQKAKNLKIVACADLNMEAVRARAQEYGCDALTVDELLAHPEIEIVVNLTIPKAHAEVSQRVLHAGKHVYLEKPLAVTVEEALSIMKCSEETGYRVGCAPDTFLGYGQQAARKVIDDGLIGKPLSGVANIALHGHESWHPSPAFYYAKGGGPMLDMGPYYLHSLVNMLGPIESVSGMTSRGFDKRIATSEGAHGLEMDVEVETHQTGTLRFVCGAIITLIASFDIWKNSLPQFEIYGTAGSLKVPDPNTFTGPVQVAEGIQGSEWEAVALDFAENGRIIGVIDFVEAIRKNRPHRASGALALHVLETMEAFEASSKTGQHVFIKHQTERPAAIPLGLEPWTMD